MQSTRPASCQPWPRHARRWRTAAVLLAACAAGAAQADLITGVTVSFAGGGAVTPGHIVDGSGLTGTGATATHAASLSGNAGIVIGASNKLTFNLHGSYDLSSMAVWNHYSASAASGATGLKSLLIEIANGDGVFTPLAGAPTQVSQSTSAPVTAQLFALTGTATHVRFSQMLNWNGNASVALGEVMFFGTPAAPAAVPEPGALALAALGLAACGLVRVRRPVSRCVRAA